jgi:hypothetical protein
MPLTNPRIRVIDASRKRNVLFIGHCRGDLPSGGSMSARPILIIEDDAALRATLVEQLTCEGSFLPEAAESAADAEAMLDTADARYDAILLDIGLPDGDGRDLCARLRRDGKKMPVIMLTGAPVPRPILLHKVWGYSSAANC